MTIPKLNRSIKRLTVKQVDSTNEASNKSQNKLIDEVKDREYSISQFKKDFHEIFQNKVLITLREYESERIKKKNEVSLYSNVAILVSAICIALFIGCNLYFLFKGFNLLAIYFIDNFLIGIGITLIVIFYVLYLVIHIITKKNFEYKLKLKIIPVIMEAFPGFSYQRTPTLTYNEINSSMILPSPMRFNSSDDCFLGKYKDVKIDITEGACMTSHNYIGFAGVIIKIKMNKNFEGTTIIRPKKSDCADDYSDLKNAKLQEVILEDTEFNNEYVIYSTDQVEARYLITTVFLERFRNIKKCFNAKCIYCSFINDSIFLGVHTGTDLFSIGDLYKPVTDFKQFDTMLEEFVSIIELVDLLKLDKNIGL